MGDVVVRATGVGLSYGPTPAVVDASLSIEAGESVAMMGRSGSGKSSVLHCLAGVLLPDAGEIDVAGAAVQTMSESERSRHRLARLGMVFQFGNMVPELTLLENVALPLQLLGRSGGAAREMAMTELERLDVASVADRRAGAVSGGQAQRAAVARALVHRPPVILADEPTGALDSTTADQVLLALRQAADDLVAALLVVTHENRVAAHCDRLVTMHDGHLDAPQPVRS